MAEALEGQSFSEASHQHQPWCSESEYVFEKQGRCKLSSHSGTVESTG